MTDRDPLVIHVLKPEEILSASEAGMPSGGQVEKRRQCGGDARPAQPAGAGSNPAPHTEIQREVAQRLLAESGFESAAQVRRIVARS